MIAAGDWVIKVIRGPEVRTATLEKVTSATEDGSTVFLGDEWDIKGVNAFSALTGAARVDYIPGFTSYLVPLDNGEEKRMYRLLAECAERALIDKREEP